MPKLLAELILDSIAADAGKILVPRRIAKTWGADWIQVRDFLVALRKQGILRGKVITPKDGKTPPYEVFCVNKRPFRKFLQQRSAA